MRHLYFRTNSISGNCYNRRAIGRSSKTPRTRNTAGSVRADFCILCIRLCSGHMAEAIKFQIHQIQLITINLDDGWMNECALPSIRISRKVRLSLPHLLRCPIHSAIPVPSVDRLNWSFSLWSPMLHQQTIAHSFNSTADTNITLNRIFLFLITAQCEYVNSQFDISYPLKKASKLKW